MSTAELATLACTFHTRAHVVAAHALEPSAAVLAQEAWRLFVQREAIGLRGQRQVIAEYNIPREVLVRIGAR